LPVEVTLPSELLKKFANLSLSNFFEESLFLKKGQDLTHQQKINEVAAWFRAERLVFVLGAGASASYGLPDWNTLLQKLLLITIKSEHGKEEDGIENIDEKAGVLARTFSNVFEPNPIIAARYLHNYFKKKHPHSALAFENAIRDTLYGELRNGQESDLLKEIRQFCIAAGRSPNIDSIITYNYDDLLEQCLKNLDVDIPFFAIHSRGMKNGVNELPIYHVHGYLPQTGKITSKNKVILSEDEYHHQYSDVYGWSNLIQINKFKDHNCLFIGLSFTDPNLRRLLDISKNERGDDRIHHYCFKKRYNKEEVKKSLEKLLSENSEILDEKARANLGLDEVVEELNKLMEKFEENDALSFGVGVIWINSYDEIPDTLKKIRLHE
jgi:hypothetical protein